MLQRGQRPLRPGVARLLCEASAAGLKLAIASTTTAANVDALLYANRAHLPGVRFDAIACGDQVAKKKPSPRIYDLVLSMLRLPASACVAFEDSMNGLRAAKGAGLATIVTPNRWSAAEDFSGADRVFDSLESFHVETAREILGGAHAAA
jgi:HAD superfamily hydrolase (TIGR01509 family)